MTMMFTNNWCKYKLHSHLNELSVYIPLSWVKLLHININPERLALTVRHEHV
jgi:hypothetical protein